MLEDFIIEEIKRRDRIKELEDKRPILEIEIEYPSPTRNAKLPEDDGYCKVIIIDLDIED